MASAAQTSFAFSEGEQSTMLGGDSQQRTGPDVGATNTPPLLRAVQAENATTSITQGVESFGPQEIRAYNRAISRRELLPQRDQIASQRNALFAKSLDTQLAPREQRQLRYLEWQLERIEDADIGDQLDLLSAIAEAHERLGGRVESWLEQVKTIRPRESKSPRPRKRRT